MPAPDNETLDPRVIEARRRLQEATDHEREKLARQQQRRPGGAPGFSADWLRYHLGHAIGMSIGITFAGLAAAWCYHLLHIMFALGRIVALPTGLICAAVLSYISAYLLASVQAAFEGESQIEAMSFLDWREWFWTLPSTLGVMILAGVLGFALGYAWPLGRPILVCLSMFCFYPVFQLSFLESGTWMPPVSIAVVRSLVHFPIEWMLFYMQSGVVAVILLVIAMFTWRDPPYITIAIMGPMLSLAIMFYARLLGRLAGKMRPEGE